MSSAGAPRSRTVAMLFTDDVGSTARSEALSPEAAEVVRTTHFSILSEAVASTGGTVVKNLGDGLMVAYESTAGAVAGAVRMQQAVSVEVGRGGPDWAVRIGVSVGEATPDGDDWFGTPVVEAARLCGIADGGQILATATVRALLPRDTARFEAVGVRMLKGMPTPVEVFAVMWSAEDADGRFPLPPGLVAADPTLFVGRDVELERMTQAWRRARSGERQVVLLAGEPGIGKTRLAGRLAEVIHGDGGVVLFGRCYEEPLVSYQPFVEALRHVGHDLLDQVSGVAASVDDDTASVDQQPVNRLSFFDGVVERLGALARARGAVLILDDLHWADRPTLLLLQHLVHAHPPPSLLVLGTYRDTDLVRGAPLGDTLADLRRERLFERILLPGLTEDELSRFIATRSSYDPPVAFTHALHVETEGNPFFVEEVLLHLVEKGALVYRAGKWVTDASAIEDLGIPEGVREVIGRRLDRAGPETSSALSAAAVLGREFDLRVLEFMTGAPIDALIDVLDSATMLRLVSEGAPGTYQFTHALIRQTLYEELSTAKRLQLHRRAGEALEALYGEDPGVHLSELAHHFSQLAYGTDAARAVRYCERAAEQALSVLAYEDAVDHYQRAIQVLDIAELSGGAEEIDLQLALASAMEKVSATSARAVALAMVDLARELGDRSRLVRAVAAMPLGTTAETWPFFGMSGHEKTRDDIALLEEAAAIIDHGDLRSQVRVLGNLATVKSLFPEYSEEEVAILDRRAAESSAALNDRAEHARLLLGRHFYMQYAAEPEARRKIIDELNEMAALPGIASLHSAVWVVNTGCLLIEGDVAGLVAAIDAHPGSDDGRPSLAVERELPMQRSIVAHLQGRLEDAERLARDYIERCAPDDQWAFFRYGLMIYAVRREQGRLAELEPGLRDLVAQMTTRGADWMGVTAALAFLYCDTERFDDAARVVSEIIADDRSRIRSVGTIFLALLGESAVVLGNRDLAAEIYDRLLPYDGQAVTASSSYSNGAVARYLGITAHLLGDDVMAEHHLSAALEMNSRMGALPSLARTQLDLARVLRVRNEQAESTRTYELARAASTTATELGMALLARRAAEFIAEG